MSRLLIGGRSHSEATWSDTDLLGHSFDPPVLGLGWWWMRRSRHLHLAGVSRKAVRAAVKTRQKVLQRENRERWCALNGKHRLFRSKSCRAEGTSGSLEWNLLNRVWNQKKIRQKIHSSTGILWKRLQHIIPETLAERGWTFQSVCLIKEHSFLFIGNLTVFPSYTSQVLLHYISCDLNAF